MVGRLNEKFGVVLPDIGAVLGRDAVAARAACSRAICMLQLRSISPMSGATALNGPVLSTSSTTRHCAIDSVTASGWSGVICASLMAISCLPVAWRQSVVSPVSSRCCRLPCVT